jgi:phage antirepressor YoqD-like protein
MLTRSEIEKQRELQEEKRKENARGKKPHLEYQDKLYNGLLAIDAVIGSVEMYQSHETTFMAHLHAVKEMLEARIDNE